jgi:hypothetical protein
MPALSPWAISTSTRRPCCFTARDSATMSCRRRRQPNRSIEHYLPKRREVTPSTPLFQKVSVFAPGQLGRSGVEPKHLSSQPGASAVAGAECGVHNDRDQALAGRQSPSGVITAILWQVALPQSNWLQTQYTPIE